MTVHIVLDTNVFFSDFRMEGNSFRVLLASTERLGIILYVPEVVLDEITSCYKRELEDLKAKLEKTALMWQKRTGRPICSLLSNEDVVQECDRYAAWLTSKLESIEAKIPPYPDVSHRVLAQRSMARKRPFRTGDKGYRDALIWETVLDLCAALGEPMVLVSKNKKDFGDGPEPHSDLVADLRERGLREDIVRVLSGLGELKLHEQLERLDDLVSCFSTDAVPEFSLNSWVEEQLIDVLREEEWSGALLDLTSSNSVAWLSSVDNVASITVDDVRRLPNGDLLLAATVRLSVTVQVDGDTEAYYKDEAYRELWENEFSPDCISAWFPVEATVQFSIVLQAGSLIVLSAEIDGVDSDYGSFWVQPHPMKEE